jgi:hypothetical protein
MAAWTTDELAKIGASEEVQIASVRRDGTLRSPTTIWVARHGDDLYIRSVRGRDAHWFRGTQERHEGWIRAGNLEKDVTFVDAANANEEVDAAYRAKYGRYAGRILNSVVTPEARSTTLKLAPR